MSGICTNGSTLRRICKKERANVLFWRLVFNQPQCLTRTDFENKPISRENV